MWLYGTKNAFKFDDRMLGGSVGLKEVEMGNEVGRKIVIGVQVGKCSNHILKKNV